MERQQESLPRLWTKPFITVTLSNLFLFLNLQMITVVLPAFIAAEYGASSVTISWVISIFALVAILTRFYAGNAIMRLGKSRMLLIGLIIYLAATASYYWAGAIALIMLVRILYGVGFGLTSTAVGTMASDIIPPKRIGEGMGYFGLSSGLSMSLAPVIGLAVYQSFGFDVLILVSAILVAIVFPLAVSLRAAGKEGAGGLHAAEAKRRAEDGGAKEKRGSAENGRKRLIDKEVLLPCFLNLFFTVTYGGLISFLTMFGKETHIANVGWFFLFNALAVMLVRPFAGKLFDRNGPVAVLPAGALFVIAGLVLLSFAASTAVMIVAAVSYGIGYGILQPSLQAWTVKRVSPERRGAATGMFYNSTDLGIAIGSLLLGIVATQTSYAMMYRLSAGFLVLFLLFYGLSYLSQGSKRGQTASSGQL
ncbi:MFS transporter [Paenibacillus sp. MBLB4367]|uniref:MFS transporter n=1 Tax=Paenibacillus sp. MBLB4367 TaxID=3384767 RepID=UPI0039080C6B